MEGARLDRAKITAGLNCNTIETAGKADSQIFSKINAMEEGPAKKKLARFADFRHVEKSSILPTRELQTCTRAVTWGALSPKHGVLVYSYLPRSHLQALDRMLESHLLFSRYIPPHLVLSVQASIWLFEKLRLVASQATPTHVINSINWLFLK